MKKILISFCATATILAGGCVKPVAVGSVGPDPMSVGSIGQHATDGHLQVFSRVTARSDDQSQAGDGVPLWDQHTPYTIYNIHGRRIKYVGNDQSHYETAPRDIDLPVGRYVVKARGQDYLIVKVPVVIEPGQTTKVHLDGAWTPPEGTPKQNVIFTPDGSAVGWRAVGASKIK